MKSTQKKLFTNLLVLVLCVAMLTGTTFAWFTDSATSTGNIVKAGKLDLKMFWTDDLTSGNWHDVEGANKTLFDERDSQGNEIYWEPGYTEVRYIKIQNTGNLAFNFDITLEAADSANVGELAPAINVYAAKNVQANVTDRTDLGQSGFGAVGMLNTMMNGGKVVSGTVIPAGQTNPQYDSGETIVAIALQMIPTAGNEYQGKNLGAGFNIKALATQCAHEEDAFGNNYDGNATPGNTGNTLVATSVTAAVTSENGLVASEVTMSENGITATVPAGAKLADGVSSLTLTVNPLENSASNISVYNQQTLIPVDIHIDGLATDNTVPVVINLGAVMPVGLNLGNFTLVHVEDGNNVTMTRVNDESQLTVHNTFTYDPATGEVSVAMATFSEVALISDDENAWNGTYATAFADGEGTEEKPYLIANADQLVYMGDLVSNDNETYGNKHYKLIADINFGGNDEYIYYPIGYHAKGGEIATVAFDDAPEAYYEITEDSKTPGIVVADGGTTTWYTYGGAFKGTFDGNGHKISNIYQNTWSMEGNYSGNYWNAAMGIFGYVNGGTVKNLTVDNFSSDGEFTPTGVIAAYAANSTFENIAITNCNPRVYNTGNGGIVGIGGNSSDPDTFNLTFTNITIDNTNKISALWGSWDVACGGLIGMFRGAGHVYMTNCHVAAQIDVYNDVCGNYQYYWYRYAGMMVGTNKNMVTDANGYTVPETDKFHAENCTVHFGEWNDYYYCELVANSLASYTHDYQFSRLTEISSLDEIYSGGAWTKTGNFYHKLTDTCYHIVNKDGKLTQHNHKDAGVDIGIDENEDGEDDLKEDKQRVHLPFNQLFTGYGWGVKYIPVYNGEDYAFEGITILDREVADSVKKFERADAAKYSYKTETTVTIGELFKAAAIEDSKLAIKSENVQVTVSPSVGTNSTAGAAYVANTTDWTQGMLTFSGAGNALVTITDYYFCTPTTIEVEIEAVEKFNSNFTGDFLYRVGNENNITLGTLFNAKDGAKIGDVNVNVEPLNGTNVDYAYTVNQDDWTQGTIKFEDTGIVKVTISDNEGCKPTELILEIVDATNLTNATGTTSGGNFVLLCDVNTNTYVNYWNCTLYGNGFTYSLKGAPTAYNSKQGHGILITKNATLDNLKIVGDVYNSYGAYTTQDYYNSAVDVVGDTVIQNCYISGCAAPVSTRANATISNTTLYGGTVGNLIIKSGTVTLEDVTTANYDDGRSLVGMGIVIHSDATESAKLVINGTLTQHNFISESKVPTDTYAKNLHTTMFGDSCSKYHFGTSPNRYVNAGIISLTTLFNAEDITDNANTGYVGTAVTVSGVNGYVYTQPNTSGSVNNDYDKENDTHVATTQGEVPPSYSFDYTNKNYVAKTDGSNDYCYEENGKVNISMDDGDTFNWDTSILTVTKVGQTLDYTVSMNGADYTGKSITFDTAGDYEVIYTYTDENNFGFDENGDITTYSKKYTKTVNITVAVAEAATKHAEFTFGSSNTASATVTVGNNTYVMPNVNATSSTIGSTTVSGQTIYYPIVEIVMSDKKTSHTSAWYAYFPVFSGAVTITDYKDNGLGDAETFGSSTQSMPSGLSIVGDPAQLFKYQSSSTAGTSPVVKNNILVYSSPSISAKRSEYNTVIQYSYQDNAGATYYYYIGYHAPAQSYSSCVTPDTLVTLADGSQKRIDEVTYEDQLLVWDFVNGEYTSAPSSIVMNHGYGNYDVVTLNFADGTVVNTINGHGFFDESLNEFVIISKNNVADFVGHKFIKEDGTVTELADYSINTEYTESWSVLTAEHYNCILEGMLTVTPAEVEGSPDYLMPYAVGDDMKYDSEAMQADIEKYGLYTYEEFADLLTPEQFYGLGLQNFKVAVGKGHITYDEILFLIDLHMN